MVPLLPLPRLIFGAGSLSALAAELAFLGVKRPFLMSDGGLKRAGLVTKAVNVMPAASEQFLEIPENPTAEGADSAYGLYRDAKCDGIVALGGGSVIPRRLIATLRVRRRHRIGSDECFDRSSNHLRYRNIEYWPVSQLGHSLPTDPAPNAQTIYTVAIFSNSLSINETLSPGRKYQAERDLIPVVARTWHYRKMRRCASRLTVW